MSKLLPAPLLALLLLAACGGGGGNDSATATGADRIWVERDVQAHPGPAPGSTRAGSSYDVTIKAADGNDIAFTVHEPVQLVGGQKYPLLLNGPGFASPRTSAAARELAAPPGTPLVDIQTVKPYLDAGYGVISFDQRGFGQSGGSVTIMDPDHDGPNLIAIVDWAEANLDWLQYRDGNLLLGSYGGSYGGMYQLLLNAIDPQHRLDAMIPQIAPNDLDYSLNPGNVPKSGWALILAGAGEVSSRDNMDPQTQSLLLDAVTAGRFDDEGRAFLHYHSHRYFCDGVSLPGKRAAVHPPKVDVLLFQGMHDALFNLNEGKANYECFKAAGGDVRLIGYNIGHVLPAGLGLISAGSSSLADAGRCGPYVEDQMSLAWFDAKLKRDPAAIAKVNAFPQQCLAIASNGEGVVLDPMPVGGTNYDIAALTVPELTPLPVTTALFTATEPTVIAGIPTATLTLANPAPAADLPDGLPLGVASDDAIVFVSLALSHAGLPAQLEIIDDQVRPVRGFGTHTLELNGIGVKLAPGDQLQLLVSGMSEPQFPAMFARNPLLPLLNVSGSVQVPVLGNVATVQ